MFKKLKSFFENKTQRDGLQPEINKAVTFILLEVACADQHLKNTEIDQIKKYLTTQNLVPVNEIEIIINELIKKHDWVLSIQPHTRLINEQFSDTQKINLLEQCWQIAYADNELDKHEEHRIRKLSELLYCSHKSFIQTKLKIIGHK